MDAIRKIEERQELIAQLRKAAMQISDAGYLGWGNSCIDAAIALTEDAQTLASKEAELVRLREALVLADGAMNYMGDILNSMDITDKDDEEKTSPAFEAVLAALTQPTE